MICPLLTIAAPQPHPTDITPEPCLGEQCAWWHHVDKGCALLSLQRDAEDIVTNLKTIAENIKDRY